MSIKQPVAKSTSKGKPAAAQALVVEDEGQSVPQKPLANSPASLPVLLMDDALCMGPVQEQLLAVAQMLREKGLDPHIVCPQHSALMVKAQDRGLPTRAYAQGYGGALGLIWRFSRKRPLLIHVFSATCLPLATRLFSWRQQGKTGLLHTYSILAQASSYAAHTKALEQMHTVILPSHFAVQSLPQNQADSLHYAVVHPAHTPSALECVNFPAHEGAQGELERDSDPRCNFVFALSLREEGDLDHIFACMQELLEEEKKTPPQKASFEVRILCLTQPTCALETYITKARGLGLEHRLCILGEQDALQVLASSSVLVLPESLSAQEHEVCVDVLMAAYALGMPIIACHKAPYAEFEPQSMLVVDTEDKAALCSALHSMMYDGHARSMQAQRAAAMRSYALMPRLAIEYEKVYSTILQDLTWCV